MFNLKNVGLPDIPQDEEIMELNNELVGQTVFVLPDKWFGRVEKVMDEQTFYVKGERFGRKVDMHHIRTLDYFK